MKGIKIRLTKAHIFLIFFFSLLLSFSSGLAFGLSEKSRGLERYPVLVNLTRENPEGREELDFNEFWRVWDTLEAQYYDKSQIMPSKLVYGAIQGMVAAVGDPYTIFLTPSENRVSTEDLSGDFEGVGIQIGFRGQQLAVVSPLPGSPAEEAGIQAGDFIAQITDEERDIDIGTVGITLPDAVQAIRGPAGSVVTLTLVREGEEELVVVDVERETINVPSVSLSYEGDGGSVAHVKVTKFGEDTLNEWNEIVAELLVREGLDGVVLDLRNNPGGFLMRAVDLAAEFMDVDSVVVIEEWGDGRQEKYSTDRIGRLKGEDLVVLVNGGSASASEILAGALQDNLGTPVVGVETFGKGTIQEAQQLDDGAGLHITVAKWLTPEGRWVNEGGIDPDYEVEDNPETLEDEQLLRAVEIVSG